MIILPRQLLVFIGMAMGVGFVVKPEQTEGK